MSFYDKYILYKNKYINLKNQIREASLSNLHNPSFVNNETNKPFPARPGPVTRQTNEPFPARPGPVTRQTNEPSIINPKINEPKL
jgi:hypothetical protein